MNMSPKPRAESREPISPQRFTLDPRPSTFDRKFSAVILAGGKSSRMGRDKAFVEISGQTLLARQIQLARELGAAEIFISGRADVDYSPFGCRVWLDEVADAGPLAGIARALAETSAPLLLVLAVDLPEMSAEFLRRLATHCTETTGVIPRVAGQVEPLAAFYPKTSEKLLAALTSGRLSLTPALSRWEREPAAQAANILTAASANPAANFSNDSRTILPLPAGEGWGEGERSAKQPSAKFFAARCVAAELASYADFLADDTKFFTNWNSPADMW
jgi:molybdopterin-guanine dinucleotide biosynthesis protein A